jgi:hypothetical protein
LLTVFFIVLVWCGNAFAQTQTSAQDKLLEDQSAALPWIVGAGILVGILIAGFKHPGRTHLD